LPKSDSDDNMDDDDDDDDFCVVCNGYFYAKDGPKCDWIQFVSCSKWLHEDCSSDSLHYTKC
jgi:hypothetical protein